MNGTLYLNLHSRGRALLLLFLLSDVTEGDAPTRVCVGSHLDIPHILAPAGDAGLSFLEVAEKMTSQRHRPAALVTGNAGDVYLCHPFLAHSATWPHRGKTPRFIAQPGLEPTQPLQLNRADGKYSPVEAAIRLGLELGAERQYS